MDIERIKSFARRRVEGLKAIASDVDPVNVGLIPELEGKVEAYEEILGFIHDFEVFEKELGGNGNK